MEIVRTPSDFTPEWLTAELHRAGVLKTGKVVEVAAETIGTGQLGCVVRLTPAYENAPEDAPTSIVAKLAAINETSRRTGIALGVYEAEVRFYERIAATVGMRTPQCWFAGFDAIEGWFTLLFEDLGDYVVGNVLDGATVERARRALHELVRLQASRWNDPALREFAWLADRSRSEKFFALFPASLPVFREAFSALVDPALVRLAERVVPRAAEYVSGWSGPAVIQHGDYRLDNMLLGCAPSHSPLVVVDWQTVRLGPPLLDAAFYLGGSLAPDLRRRHEQALIREYHEALLAAGVRDFSWQECWEGYRLHALYGFFMAAGTCALVQQNERGLAMYKSSIERHGTHAVELDAESLLT